jgi:hypothetical protein
MKDIKIQNRKIKLSQNRVKILRENRRAEKGKVYEAILKTRKDEVKMVKLEEKRNSRIKSEMTRRVRTENQKKSRSIKEQLRLAERKRQEYEKAKHDAAKKEFEDRIKREMRLKRQKEKEVMQMEMIEMELIKKLQNTQNIQKSAYQELENALAQPSVFFHNQRQKSSNNEVSEKSESH